MDNEGNSIYFTNEFSGDIEFNDDIEVGGCVKSDCIREITLSNLEIKNANDDVVLKTDNADITINNNLSVDTIEDRPVIKGEFSGLETKIITNALPSSMFPNNFTGSRIFPANTIKEGETWRIYFTGLFSKANLVDYRISFLSGTGSTLINEYTLTGIPAFTNGTHTTEITFSVPEIGTTGVASVKSSITHRVISNTGQNLLVDSASNQTNNLTFDTTISNTFQVLFQFLTLDAANEIRSYISTFHKLY